MISPPLLILPSELRRKSSTSGRAVHINPFTITSLVHHDRCIDCLYLLQMVKFHIDRKNCASSGHLPHVSLLPFFINTDLSSPIWLNFFGDWSLHVLHFFGAVVCSSISFSLYCYAITRSYFCCFTTHLRFIHTLFQLYITVCVSMSPYACYDLYRTPPLYLNLNDTITPERICTSIRYSTSP